VHDPSELVRFNRTAVHAGTIVDDHVAQVYDFGETDDGLVYLAMEYVPGDTLTRMIKKEGPFEPQRVAELTRQVAKGLDAAHAKGIIHRDLKPDNVMVMRDRNGREMVKIVDFGIAKALGQETHDLTHTGAIIGTLLYMSPEQLAGSALDRRSDPQNLPPGLTKETWPKDTYASMSPPDYGMAYTERAEIYDLVRDAKITGFAIVSGDRHSFWGGYATSQLPPGKFEPVGLSFVGASLSSAGTMEAVEHNFPKDNPLRPLFLADRPAAGKPDWTHNMLLRHGVRACLEYAKSFDLKRARSLSNPELAPHLEFVDLGAHGYAKVQLTAAEMRTEFVCIPRPITRSERADGGPLRYRVLLTAALWKSGERPRLKTSVLEGDVGLAI